jgi:hypothetical protein
MRDIYEYYIYFISLYIPPKWGPLLRVPKSAIEVIFGSARK